MSGTSPDSCLPKRVMLPQRRQTRPLPGLFAPSHAVRAMILRVAVCINSTGYSILCPHHTQGKAPCISAGVAQLVEQLTCNQQVGGSIPFAGSIQKPNKYPVNIGYNACLRGFFLLDKMAADGLF